MRRSPRRWPSRRPPTTAGGPDSDEGSGSRAEADPDVERKLHQTIRQVTRQIPELSYNTSIAAMMEYLNAVRAGGRKATRREVEPLVVMIAPFAPHVAEELWEHLGHDRGIFDRANWPTYDEAKTRETSVKLAVQVNGKLRATVEGPAGMDQEAAEAAARSDENVARYLDGATLKRVHIRTEPTPELRSGASLSGASLMPESPTGLSPELDRLCIDAIRVLAMDAVQKANSGHPGTPMALAPLGYLLWTQHLSHNPADPSWADRDRFVLSVGHASMLLYSLLHLTGYDLSMEEIVNFRQWGSLTPGHPELGHTPGAETTTGPLGQGVANSVGMALAERWLAARFNRPGHDVVDHYTYAICSDGDLMEGISHEVAALAGHQRLGKLILDLRRQPDHHRGRHRP